MIFLNRAQEVINIFIVCFSSLGFNQIMQIDIPEHAEIPDILFIYLCPSYQFAFE